MFCYHQKNTSLYIDHFFPTTLRRQRSTDRSEQGGEGIPPGIPKTAMAVDLFNTEVDVYQLARQGRSACLTF